MTADDLTKGQIQQLHDAVANQLGYLGALKRRMERRRFSPTDPLYVKTCEAFNAVLALRMDLHYLSCNGGVGKPPREDKTRPNAPTRPAAQGQGDNATGKIDPQMGTSGG